MFDNNLTMCCLSKVAFSAWVCSVVGRLWLLTLDPILLEGVKFQRECIIKCTYDGIPLGCSVVIITFFERFYARDTLFFKML